METVLVWSENHDLRKLYVVKFFTNIKCIFQSASENRKKKSTAQFTRTTQCLKFSCYDLYNCEIHIYVCQIIFFGHRLLASWEITSLAGPLGPNSLGCSNNLIFCWWSWTLRTFQDPEHGCWWQDLDMGTMLNRQAPNAQSRIICMGKIWFYSLFICIWFHEWTKAADLSTALACSPSLSAC